MNDHFSSSDGADADWAALDPLHRLLYDQLKRIAISKMGNEQPTALVSEVFSHLPRGIKDKAHLMALASIIMRNILIDQARAQVREEQKRKEMDPLNEFTAYRVDRALTRLAEIDPRQAQ